MLGLDRCTIRSCSRLSVPHALRVPLRTASHCQPARHLRCQAKTMADKMQERYAVCMGEALYGELGGIGHLVLHLHPWGCKTTTTAPGGANQPAPRTAQLTQSNLPGLLQTA